LLNQKLLTSSDDVIATAVSPVARKVKKRSDSLIYRHIYAYAVFSGAVITDGADV